MDKIIDDKINQINLKFWSPYWDTTTVVIFILNCFYYSICYSVWSIMKNFGLAIKLSRKWQGCNNPRNNERTKY